MGTKEEINAMFDAMERTIELEEEQPVDEPQDEPQPPADEPNDSEPAPATDQPIDADEPEKVDDKPPATDAPKEIPDEYRKEIAELKAEIDRIKNPKPEPKLPAPVTDPPVPDEDFIKDIDIDDVTREPGAFNKLLNSIYKKAVTFARSEIKRTSEVIPTQVVSEIERKEKMKMLSDKFFETNSDLKQFPKVVATVFGELSEQNPDKTYLEVLEMVGVETRKRLDLKQPDSKPADPKPNPKPKDEPPPLPRKRGAKVIQTKDSDPNSIVNQIDAMNKVLIR